jgi:hypothetical protein
MSNAVVRQGTQHRLCTSPRQSRHMDHQPDTSPGCPPRLPAKYSTGGMLQQRYHIHHVWIGLVSSEANHHCWWCRQHAPNLGHNSVPEHTFRKARGVCSHHIRGTGAHMGRTGVARGRGRDFRGPRAQSLDTTRCLGSHHPRRRV